MFNFIIILKHFLMLQIINVFFRLMVFFGLFLYLLLINLIQINSIVIIFAISQNKSIMFHMLTINNYLFLINPFLYNVNG